MAINESKYIEIVKQLQPQSCTLVAVSKTKPVEDIAELYKLGHRDFGENYVQELLEKQPLLPADTQWHFIGHLQSNKVKYIAPFIHLIHSVDSFKLLQEVNKQALKNNRVINVLIQVFIAEEETKFGMDETELNEMFHSRQKELEQLKNVNIKGFMGMASFTEELMQVRKEFKRLNILFQQFRDIKAENISFEILSMGMSSDYPIAMEEGSNMVRIGSLLFGERNYS